jgi:tetratricopeptide (TPR) repeat protein
MGLVEFKKFKLMKMKVLFVCFAYLGIVFNISAQTDWNWPEDKATAEMKYVLYKDALKQDNFQAAKEPHLWLLQNVPNLHNSLYIDGARIYESLAEVEKDPQKKLQLQDSALLMYDLRIKYFNDEANVLNRKAFTAYGYFANNRDKLEELYNIFERTFELNGNKVANYIIPAYMDVVRRYKAAGGPITDEKVIDIYDRVNQILDWKAENAPDNRLDNIRENVEKVFMASVDIDCNFIKSNMSPRLAQNPDDLVLAKKIMALMLAAKCNDDPEFLNTVIIINKKEPAYGLSYLIGIRYIQQERYNDAMTYLKQAIELTEENSKKGDILMKLGDIENLRNNHVAARGFYRQAVNTDPSQTDAYKKIGDMYFNSYNECQGGQNSVQDRAVFLAAFEMYRRAGDAQAMARAKNQFPSREEAFQWDMTAGTSLTVGCWINETVTLQTRD